MTWEFFLAEFRKREFVNLRQRHLTVAEYEREFVWLSRYAREIVPTDANRCRRFMEGLNDNIKLHIIALLIKDFTQLVAAAMNIERVRDSEQSKRTRAL